MGSHHQALHEVFDFALEVLALAGEFAGRREIGRYDLAGCLGGVGHLVHVARDLIGGGDLLFNGCRNRRRGLFDFDRELSGSRTNFDVLNAVRTNMFNRFQDVGPSKKRDLSR